MSITRVPLSTVFTAPASCSSSWTYEASTYNGASRGLLLQNAEAGFLDTDCFPPGFLGAGRVPASQVFSPGACPDGYVTQSPILVNGGVTTASCCSQGFTYFNDGNQGCVSTFTGATSLTARAGGFDVPDTTSHTSISGTFPMWGQVLTVEYKANQLSLYTTTTSRSSSAASTAAESTSSPATSISSTSSMSSPSQTPSSILAPSNHSSGGLTAGAKAGIAIAAVVVALLLIGAAVWWKRGRRSVSASLNTGEPHGQLQDKYGARSYSIPAELGAGQTGAQPGPGGYYGRSEMPT